MNFLYLENAYNNTQRFQQKRISTKYSKLSAFSVTLENIPPRNTWSNYRKNDKRDKNILKLVKDNSQCTNTMFFVEICNLTEKFSSNTHQFVTKICNHSSQKVHTTIQADNQSFHKLRTFNCKVHFATISTVSLTSYINFRQKKGNLRKSIHQCEHITYQQKSN